MGESVEATKEAAKAVQEVAKTTGKVVDVAQGFGRFASRFIEGPLEEVSGIIEDTLSYVRWERRARLMARADARMAELGISGPTRMLPLNFAVPLLQAASLEGDDALQDLWVNLLVNSVDADYAIEIKRAYISILQDFGSLEARIVETIYSRPDLETAEGFWTRRLPHNVEIEQPPADDMNPTPEVSLALGNLVRLNCLTLATMWDGPQDVICVYPTSLGRGLYKACVLRPCKS